MKLAFLLCDLDATGGVTLANLTRVLGLANPGLQPATAGSSGAADGGAPPASPAARGGGGGVPFLQRSDSARRAAFDKYDLDGDRVLDLHEFAAFVREHTDILEARHARATTGTTTSCTAPRRAPPPLPGVWRAGAAATRAGGPALGAQRDRRQDKARAQPARDRARERGRHAQGAAAQGDEGHAVERRTCSECGLWAADDRAGSALGPGDC